MHKCNLVTVIGPNDLLLTSLQYRSFLLHLIIVLYNLCSIKDYKFDENRVTRQHRVTGENKLNKWTTPQSVCHVVSHISNVPNNKITDRRDSLSIKWMATKLRHTHNTLLYGFYWLYRIVRSLLLNTITECKLSSLIAAGRSRVIFLTDACEAMRDENTRCSHLTWLALSVNCNESQS